MLKVHRTINTLANYLIEGWILNLGVSGKDSFCVAHCLLEAMKQVKAQKGSVPHCYFETIDTTVENPEIAEFMQDVHYAIDEYARIHKLPVTTAFVHPPVNDRPMVQYIGRGILLRTFENQRKARQCTVSWKIEPLKRFMREVKKRHQTDKILMLSGSRDEESASRAANLAKRGEDIAVITTTDIGFKLAPIKDWSLSDVWGLVGQIDDGHVESFGEDVSRDLIRHYRNGNGGTCDLLAGNKTGNNKPCSSRFGCWICALVKEDKSLQNQIETDPQRYGYMAGLVRLRNYMLNTVNDYLLTRSIAGKEIKEGGFIKVGFNDYSMQYRKQLLRYVLTLDALEEEREEAAGESGPRFQIITYPDLIAIQFHWARTGGESHAFEAIKTWFEIKEGDARWSIPDSSYTVAANVTFSGAAWFDVQRMMDTYQVKGLEFSEEEEAWLGQPYRFYTKEGEAVSTVPFTQADSYEFGLNGDAWEYVENVREYYERGLLERGVSCPTIAIKDMLVRGVVKVKKGLMPRLNEQVKRAQAVNIIEHNGVSYEYYVMKHRVTPAAYQEALEAQKHASPQQDMFACVR